MAFAFVVDGVLQAVGRLPGSARLLDTGEWFMPPGGLRAASEADRAACGWFQVTDVSPLFDSATQVLERGAVVLVDGFPVVDYTVRDKTPEELAADAQTAADETERDAARNAIANLDAYLALTSPTNAQVKSAVDYLAKVARRLIIDQYGRS